MTGCVPTWIKKFVTTEAQREESVVTVIFLFKVVFVILKKGIETFLTWDLKLQIKIYDLV